MPITLNGTAGVTYPDGVLQGSGVPTASATSGAPLVSNGAVYTQTTAVGVAFGGTGATDAATARTNLGTNDAANITTGTLSSARLPSSGVNAASITAGTLAVANGGTGTSTPSLVAGSGITVTGSFPNQTIAATGGGTVTSVATGNGLSGGTITTTGTLVIAAPGYNTVGSYTSIFWLRQSTGPNFYAPGSSIAGSLCLPGTIDTNGGTWRILTSGSLSGTQRVMGYLDANTPGDYSSSIVCRIS